MAQNKQRLHLLDLIRGITLVSMMLYHAAWNLKYLFGVSIPWYSRLPGQLWQQSICWTFIILSGFCWSLSRGHLRRGLVIFGGGVLVSLVTGLVMPENRILWGILTCTGSCVLILIPLEPLLKKLPAPAGLIGSFALFCFFRNTSRGTLGFGITLPDFLYRNLFTAWLGFPAADFFSTDYFPLIPWLFLFIFGYFLFRFLSERDLIERLFSRGQLPVLNWLGRHSLIVYLLHQPIIYGISLAVQYRFL